MDNQVTMMDVIEEWKKIAIKRAEERAKVQNQIRDVVLFYFRIAIIIYVLGCIYLLLLSFNIV